VPRQSHVQHSEHVRSNLDALVRETSRGSSPGPAPPQYLRACPRLASTPCMRSCPRVSILMALKRVHKGLRHSAPVRVCSMRLAIRRRVARAVRAGALRQASRLRRHTPPCVCRGAPRRVCDVESTMHGDSAVIIMSALSAMARSAAPQAPPPWACRLRAPAGPPAAAAAPVALLSTPCLHAEEHCTQAC
jgi:hypothetical protein